MTVQTTVSNQTARAARTGIQAGPAWVLTEFIDAFLYDLSDRQFGALVALLLIVLSYVQVILENHAGWALFRSANRVAPTVTNVT
jgi:hypothetical protein